MSMRAATWEAWLPYFSPSSLAQKQPRWPGVDFFLFFLGHGAVPSSDYVRVCQHVHKTQTALAQAQNSLVLDFTRPVARETIVWRCWFDELRPYV